mmetsp:Transcript_23039/g.48174  ORF Transcript_23039/g.48174 Transcript_23039/m.48174 type:complete len:367 (+) Transcript_23039:80-1180(+)
MIQKLGAYAIVATALVILLSSTVRITLAIYSKSSVASVDDFDVHLDDKNDEPPILPINRRKFAVSKDETGPGGVSDTIPALSHFKTSRTVDYEKDQLPYKCGVIMYDHYIPGEGGDALNAWIKELVKSNSNDDDNDESLISNSEHNSKESFVKRAEKQIQNIGQNEWKIIYNTHRDDNGLAFDADEKILRSWRDAMDLGGGNNECRFVAAVAFSDPLDHSMKQTKKLFSDCECTMEKFKGKIKEMVKDRPWKSQLDGFLFNNSENNSSMDMKEKVRRGIQLLRDHFEVVMVDDGRSQGNLAEEILRITGWSSQSVVKKATVSDGELVYSKDLVSSYGKMSTKNGDADFIDAVNHIYHNRLGFLMLQ